MRNISKEELAVILKNHQDWLRDNSKGIPADLSFANLSSADLSEANLRGANLSRSNLSYADLSYAHLSYADLSYANLSYANLRDARLIHANLRDADLRDANLRYADLRDANLQKANLRDANLQKANLLTANLIEVIGLDRRSIVPEAGQFIAYKKVEDGDCNRYILTLLVSKHSPRIGGLTERKCRVQRVKVLKAETVDGKPTSLTRFYSSHTRDFQYHVGQWVKSSFNRDIREVCTSGIHCFITKQEAIDY